MKKEYNIPEISVVMFETEDIITTSTGDTDNLLDKWLEIDPEVDFDDLFGPGAGGK